MTYSLAFEELQALTAMGMTLADYEALPGTPDWINPAHPTLCKSDVIAWYRLSGRIPAVQQTAAAKKTKGKR